MKIAGVSVNIKSLPSKEQLIELALKGVKYYQLPRVKAVKLIESEIKASELFKTSTAKVKKPNNNGSGLSGLSTSRKRKVDKGSDKK